MILLTKITRIHNLTTGSLCSLWEDNLNIHLGEMKMRLKFWKSDDQDQNMEEMRSEFMERSQSIEISLRAEELPHIIHAQVRGLDSYLSKIQSAYKKGLLKYEVTPGDSNFGDPVEYLLKEFYRVQRINRRRLRMIYLLDWTDKYDAIDNDAMIFSEEVISRCNEVIKFIDDVNDDVNFIKLNATITPENWSEFTEEKLSLLRSFKLQLNVWINNKKGNPHIDISGLEVCMTKLKDAETRLIKRSREMHDFLFLEESDLHELEDTSEANRKVQTTLAAMHIVEAKPPAEDASGIFGYYGIFFEEKDGSISIVIPDVKNANTCSPTKGEAVHMAEDVLAGMLSFCTFLPPASTMGEITGRALDIEEQKGTTAFTIKKVAINPSLIFKYSEVSREKEEN